MDLQDLTPKLRARAGFSDLPEGFVAVDSAFAERLTSTHEREFRARREPAMSFSRDIPNVGDEALGTLDERGLGIVGHEVTAGMLLIGVIEVLTSQPLSAEERLLRAIFGEAAGAVRDRSVRAPWGSTGTILSARHDESEAIVVTSWARNLEIGDVLRIDGVISVVARIEDLDCDILCGNGGDVEVVKVACARDALAARSIGPYDTTSQQPVHERDWHPGQHFSREFVRTLVERAPWAAWELMSIKCDSPSARTRTYEAIIKGENPDFRPPPPRLGADGEPAADIFKFFVAPTTDPLGPVPESIHILSALLRGLRLNVSFDAEAVEATLLDDESVLALSHGEIVTVDLLDEAGKPVPGGLRCEKVFGPRKDYACACGKYTQMRNRGMVCEVCGVEVIQSNVRRKRFGHIVLARECPDPLFEDATLTVLPVIPPDLRDAELDALYGRVLVANSANGDDSELEDAVESLMVGLPVSLAVMADHWWANSVFDKTADYSGCAHVVAAQVEPGTCMLPIELAAELFRPMTYSVLETSGLATTIKSARAMVDAGGPDVLAALRAACEDRMVVLATNDSFVARRIRTWEHPAIGVDEETIPALPLLTARIHIPLTHEASFQCAHPSPARTTAPSGWLNAAIDAESLVTDVMRATARKLKDELRDPLLRVALGRLPNDVEPDALSTWTAAEEAARDGLLGSVRGQRPAPRVDPLLAQPVEALALSVQTQELLAYAGIHTIGDLCRHTETDLLKGRGFGRQQLKEVKEVLSTLHLSLGLRD